MDKGDKHLRDKVRKARPYEPKADWNRMETLLLADAKLGRRKYVFLWGFVAGVSSILIVGTLLWMFRFQQDGQLLATLTPLAPKDSTYQELPKDISAQQSPHLPSDSESSSASDFAAKNERLQQEGSAHLSHTSIPPTPSQRSTSLYPSESSSASAFQQDDDHISHLTTQQIAEEKIALNSHLKPGSIPTRIDDNLSGIGSLDAKAVHIDGLDMHEHPVPTQLPSPALPGIRLKKWSLGMYLSGLIQPYIAESPIAISQNPLAYRWHPSVSLQLRRNLSNRISIGLAGGTDDVYYYEGYLPAGSYQNEQFNDLGSSVSVIIGRNYWAEMNGRWKIRKKHDALFQPYGEIGIGMVSNRSDYVEFFGLDGNLLSTIEKTSRLNSRESLVFIRNPYLVNNRDYIDASSTPLGTANFSSLDVNTYLTSYRSTNYFSFALAVGTEIHVSDRWMIDMKAGTLSRTQLFPISYRSDALATPLEQFQDDPNIRFQPQASFPRALNFLRVSAGLNWKF